MDEYTMKRIEEYLASESFIRFVHHRNPEDVEKWEQWIKAHPEHLETVERAILVLESLRFAAPDQPSPEADWNLLQERIRQEAFAKRGGAPSRKLMYGIVAVAGAALLTVFLWFQFWHNPMIIFETDIANRATLTLPDGSEVTLNRNSSIRFKKYWDKEPVRQVWLEGEAHFSVIHEGQTSARRFEVYTEALRIDVLGTVFTVNTRDHHAVSLESGRVDIRPSMEPRHRRLSKLKSEQSPLTEVITLQPGQTLKIQDDGLLVTSQTKLKPHISWVDGKILLHNNSLKEIIHFLEVSYGLVVQCENQQLLERKLSGQVRLDHIEDLLQVLERVLDLVIVKDDQTLKILEIKKTAFISHINRKNYV